MRENNDMETKRTHEAHMMMCTHAQQQTADKHQSQTVKYPLTPYQTVL